MLNIDKSDLNRPGRLELRLFGPPHISLDGAPFTGVTSAKAQGLLFYLAITQQGHTRLTLATLFWGELSEAAARGNLRKALQQLRNYLDDYLIIERNSVALAGEADYWVDVVEFDRLLLSVLGGRTAQSLQGAIDLYQGDFLEGFYLRNAPDFENWWLSERARLREQMLDALHALADHYAESGQLDQAILQTRRYLELEPWREGAHRRLMRFLAYSGQRSAALTQYETCRQVLADELGVEPGDETRDLYERIRTSRLIPLPGSRPKSNLPLELTSFIGRQDEIVQVQDLLQANRLVTLTGFGGVGKTRLSIRVVEEILDEFPDGVWYIDLASLADPALVAQTVALTIGLREGIGQSFQDVLVSFLRARQALIVLDNCEHLLAACTQLAEGLLRGCPDLKLLTTSREALGVAGEVTYVVPSLGLPESEEILLEKMETYDAVCLFVTRTQAALPDFQVTAQNAPSVVRICRRLDGIPLALELAASRLKMLTTEQLDARLDNAFRLLTGGNLTALPRQQTLRATIDWSYKLLDEKERTLLRRLAVFAGGFSLEGVEAVCAGDGLEGWEVFNLLASLVDKSMVNADRAQGVETRYRLLETVRQYALKKMFDAGEHELLKTQHLEYYVAFAEEAYPHLHGAGRVGWTRRVKYEYDNIREAIEWAFQDAIRAHLGLGIVINIADRFLFPMGYLQEGGDLLKTGLQAAGDTIPKLLQAQAYYYRLYLDQINDLAQDQVILEKCIRLCREAGPQAHRELSLALAWSIVFSSEEEVLSNLEEAVQIARRMGPPGNWALSWALFQKSSYLCSLSQAAFDDQAYDAALESVRLTRTGDRWHNAGYWTLGIVETRRGRMDQARKYLQKCLDSSIEIKDKGGIYSSLFCLVWHFRLTGQTGQALRYCQEMYAMSELLSSLANGLFYALGMVLIMHRNGIASKESDQARRDGLRLLALYDSIRRYWHSFDHLANVQALEQLRDQMGEAAFQAVWSEGQAMTQEEGVAYAGWLLEKYAQKEK